MAAVQRIQQGLRALFAFSRPVNDTLAADYLTPPLMALFRNMRRSERLHSLRVLRGLLAEGDVPPELAIAALLHDVGKTRYPLMIWQKTLPVLVKLVNPALVTRWSGGDAKNLLLRPFVVYVHHPEWSAELLAAAGAPERAVWLARHHQEAPALWANHPDAPLLQRLHDADDMN